MSEQTKGALGVLLLIGGIVCMIACYGNMLEDKRHKEFEATFWAQAIQHNAGKYVVIDPIKGATKFFWNDEIPAETKK